MPEPAVDFPKTVPAVKVLLHWTPPSAVVSVTTKSLREHVFVPTTGVLTTPVMAMRETWFWAGLFTSARLVIAASSVELFYTQEFQQLAEHKFRIVNQVSPPEPSRLRQQAKQPFQAVLAHPGGRLLQSACVEIERLPYTHQHRHAKLLAVFVHPAFLLGAAQSHPENVRLRPVDHFHDAGVFFRRQGAKRRRVGAGNFQHRKLALQFRGQGLWNARGSTVEKVPIAFCIRLPAKIQKQVRPIHPLFERITARATDPD